MPFLVTNNLREFHKAVHRAEKCAFRFKKKAKKQKKKLTEKGEEKFFLRHQSQCVDYIRRRSWFGETPRLDVIRITLSSHVAATTRHRSEHLLEGM